MSNITQAHNSFPVMSDEMVARVRGWEEKSLLEQQLDIPIRHTLHGGMYARTVFVPAGVLITGALIKIATLLIAQGNVLVYIGSDTIELEGYNIIPASAGRKQAFLAKTDAYLTMVFPSNAETVAEAEEEFTDEADKLASRKGNG